VAKAAVQTAARESRIQGRLESLPHYSPASHTAARIVPSVAKP
jgi:hypothetical protein